MHFKFLTYLTFIIFITSCSGEEKKSKFEILNSIPLQKVEFEKHIFENDSFSSYTENIAILLKGKILESKEIELNNAQKLKVLHLIEPNLISKEKDSIFRETIIAYDIKGDSIFSEHINETTLGEKKIYSVNGKPFKIIKQPLWKAWKSTQKPTHFAFYNENFGVLISLSRFEEITLKRTYLNKKNENIKKLIETIKADSTFFNMDYSKK